MSMKFKGDIVRTEKYTDKDGVDQKKYINVGSLLEREDGSLCINFLGSWLNIYPPKNKAPQESQTQTEIEDSDIPF